MTLPGRSTTLPPHAARGLRFRGNLVKASFGSSKLLGWACVWLSFAIVGPVQAEDRVRIAILPVMVHSADSREYVREGIADMLSARLEQVKELEVIRVDDPKHATNRAQKALEVGRKRGADYVLFGSFTRFGEGASLDIQCLAVADDPEGAPAHKIFVQAGSIGSVIPDLDDLAGRIARFAVADFDDRASALPTPPNAPRREGLADLRARVQALEDALRKQGALQPASP